MPFRLAAGLLLMLAGPALAAVDCVPTPDTGPGTHYQPARQQGGRVGQGLTLNITVLAGPDCAPVPKARVETWQADETGRYTDRLRTYQFTDRNGRARLETVWPNFDPPHIHVHVHAPGYKRVLTAWHPDRKVGTGTVRVVLEALPKKP